MTEPNSTEFTPAIKTPESAPARKPLGPEDANRVANKVLGFFESLPAGTYYHKEKIAGSHARPSASRPATVEEFSFMIGDPQEEGQIRIELTRKINGGVSDVHLLRIQEDPGTPGTRTKTEVTIASHWEDAKRRLAGIPIPRTKTLQQSLRVTTAYNIEQRIHPQARSRDDLWAISRDIGKIDDSDKLDYLVDSILAEAKQAVKPQLP